MEQEETEYLELVHKHDTQNKRKSYSVKKFKDSQTQFKNLNKELKKKETIIRNLEKKIERLNLKIEKINKPVLKIKNSKSKEHNKIFLEDVNKKDYEKHRNEINRIERYLELDRDYTRTDIIKELLINYKKLDFVLNYLMAKGIIESLIVKGVMRYKKCM